MSRWRELARRLKDSDGANGLPASPSPIVPIVPIVTATVSHSTPLASGDPAAWLIALSSLDASRPPAGIAPGWWRTVLADARWIACYHADAAAAFGWSASDLFGILPDRGPGHGGVADRLDGARRLAFTARVAHWQGEEWDGWLLRKGLETATLPWEIAS